MSNPFHNTSPTTAQGAPPPYQAVYAPPSGPPPPTQQAQQAQYNPPPGPPPGHLMGNSTIAGPNYGYTPPPAQQAQAQAQGQGGYGISSPISTHFPSSNNNPFSDPPYPHVQQQQQQQTGPQRHGSVSDRASGLTSTASTGVQARALEDPLDLLKQFDTIVVVDDSGSMQLSPHDNHPDNVQASTVSRWQEARDALAGVVHLAAQKDADGIDVHFLNSDASLENCTDPSAVKRLFDSLQPDGPTPLGTKLEMLLLAYLDEIEEYKEMSKKGALGQGKKEPKKRNYIVITDGAPTDDVESVIIAIARRLDEGRFPLSQVGFSFIQVGDDPEATQALAELDDALQHAAGVRDIVDTTAYSGMSLNSELIIKSLLGGINRRYDRKDRRASTTSVQHP